MQNEFKKQLQSELNKYLQNSNDFSPYYDGMNVLYSSLYKQQLKKVIELVKKQSSIKASDFELYLDTIIVNMHTKINKYKKSIYFDDENIKDIQNQGFTIPFYTDNTKNQYILLGIVNLE